MPGTRPVGMGRAVVSPAIPGEEPVWGSVTRVLSPWHVVVPLMPGRKSRGMRSREWCSFLRKSSEQCVEEESRPVLRGEHVGAGAPQEGGGEGRKGKVSLDVTNMPRM